MSINRITEILNNRRRESVGTPAEAPLDGFVTNPLAGSITPDQAQMYQAAFTQAWNKSAEPEWPLAESWN